MIWTICLIIAYVGLFVSLGLLIRNKFRKMGYVFSLLLFVGFIIYLPHYSQFDSLINVLLEDLINLLQIITVNSNSFESLQGTIPDNILFNHYLIVRGIVHVFLPILFAYTAVSFFVTRLSGIQLKLACIGKKNIYVFSQINPKTTMIVADICKHVTYRNTLFIICKDKFISNGSDIEDIFDEKDIDQANVIFLDRSKVIDFVKINKKRKKQLVTYFCISDNPETNICSCLELIQLYKGEKSSNNVHINVFSDDSDIDAAIIDAGNDAAISVRLIKKEQLSVYKMLMKYPLYNALTVEQKDCLHVMIVGYSKMTMEMLKAVVWCGQLTDVTLKISVLLEKGHLDKFKERIELYFPEVLSGGYNISFSECNLDSKDLKDKVYSDYADVNYIAICRAKDMENIQTRIHLRRMFYRVHGDYTYEPFIALLINNDALSNAIDNLGGQALDYKLRPFGNEASIYCYEELVHSKIEHLAQNVHLSYSIISQPAEKFDNICKELKNREKKIDALKSYYRHEDKRRSNITAAIHLQYKLWEFGFEIDESVGTDNYSELADAIHSKLMERIAETEHNRWMAFYRTEGWSTVSVEDAAKVGYLNLSRGCKSELLHMHPDICEYDEIASRCEKMNRSDTTIYDRRLIEMIPYILGDEWEVDPQQKQIFKVRRRERI